MGCQSNAESHEHILAKHIDHPEKSGVDIASQYETLDIGLVLFYMIADIINNRI